MDEAPSAVRSANDTSHPGSGRPPGPQADNRATKLAKGKTSMILARLFTLSFLVVALSACAGEVKREIVIGSPRNIQVAVPPTASVQLSLPPGDSVIEASEDGDLKADMQIRCGSETDACARHAAEVQWKVASSDTRLELSFTPDSAFQFNNSDTTTHVWVPADRPVTVNMSAGELEIRRVSGCLDVDMSAGDISIEVPAASVRTAHLDANVGDASLATPDNSMEGRRRLLVGAEVNWDKGEGACALSVDLGAGDIEAKLY
jgi:hypothetical protein